MLHEVMTDTPILYYLMGAVGVLGILAKIVNQITLRRMVKAAGTMQKSTHKLIKLIRSKYEHACMLHDRVENTAAFVGKYIYEYRGFLFRIHTWRQLEIQAVWFAGILAAAGAGMRYMEQGFCEEVYRFIALGAAEMVLLFVVSQLFDEQYKIEAAKNYMVDYLENMCAPRKRRPRTQEKDRIDVIQPDMSGTARAAAGASVQELKKEADEALSIRIEGEPRRVEQNNRRNDVSLDLDEAEPEAFYADEPEMYEEKPFKEKAFRRQRKGDAAKQLMRRAVKEREGDEERPPLKEDAIRQILEEFLA